MHFVIGVPYNVSMMILHMVDVVLGDRATGRSTSPP